MKKTLGVAFAWLVMAMASVGAGTDAGAQTLDDFEGELRWKALPSDGVNATVRTEKVGENTAMRVDYDFAKGMGFVVVRREMAIEVPESYRLSFRVRGLGPANNFEFKLIDAKADGSPGDNVWWVNKPAYEWPAEWKRVAYRNRHVSFAWGPAGGKDPLRKVAAVEFAIAASMGGKGTVWIDDLRLDTVAAADGAAPTVKGPEGSGLVTKSLGEVEICEGVEVPAAAGQAVEVTFASPREVGGLAIDLDADLKIDVSMSPNGVVWEAVRSGVDAKKGRSWIRTPGAEAQAIRVRFAEGPARTRAVIRTLGASVGDDMNALLKLMAAQSPRGAYPRYLRDEATSWTVIGLPGAEHEALLSADGQVELSKGGFAIEPFLQVEDHGTMRLLSWADATIRHELNGRVMPMVTLEWPGWYSLNVAPSEAGSVETPGVALRYSARGGEDAGRAETRVRLVLAVRPLQALPPSQWLNVTGGFTPIRTIVTLPDKAAAAMIINNESMLMPFGAAGTGMLVADGLAGEFGGSWARELAGSGDLEIREVKVRDEDGLAWGVITSPWEWSAGANIQLSIAANLRPIAAGETLRAWKAIGRDSPDPMSEWRRRVDAVKLIVPVSASATEETWRSQQRMIMVNADGPAYQPGSRTYERSWIRDGASIGTAMCFTGHVGSMRAFVEWYAGYQYETGKIPCVVDHRGPDPVPEHDSHGEFIHAVATVYRFTGDRAFVERHWAGVVKAAGYLDSIIAERSTPLYQSEETGSEERGFKIPKKAFFGLVPESISHEGYSAKAMHSHWDGFWTVRGFKDAAFLAGVLGKSERAKFEKSAGAYRANMASSVALANAVTGATWVPGCVELGDFDATSTAVAVWPVEEWDQKGGIPVELFERTFEKYWAFFEARRDGAAEWKDYTPYEVRVIGAMLRLGERDAKWLDRAHALNEWFLKDQRPAGWRQWGEVVYRDKAFAGFIGDYPHTWVGADYVNSVRAMFVDEREGNRLVVGLGVPDAWYAERADGVGIESAPTWYGKVSWRGRKTAEGGVWTISPKFRADAGEVTIEVFAPWMVQTASVNGGTLVKTEGRRVIVRGPFAETVEVRATR